MLPATRLPVSGLGAWRVNNHWPRMRSVSGKVMGEDQAMDDIVIMPGPLSTTRPCPCGNIAF